MSLQTESMLEVLGLNHTDFFFTESILLKRPDEVKPFARVVYKDGRVKMMVGDIEGASGTVHVIPR